MTQVVYPHLHLETVNGKSLFWRKNPGIVNQHI